MAEREADQGLILIVKKIVYNKKESHQLFLGFLLGLLVAIPGNIAANWLWEWPGSDKNFLGGFALAGIFIIVIIAIVLMYLIEKR